MKKCFLFVLAAIFFFFALPTAAQVKPAEDEVVRIDTQLVDVPVAVTLANGSFAGTLKATNFVVYEDGKRQTIEDFSAIAAPFEVALVLDTSGSARNELPLIKRAAKDFISALRTGDRVSIIAYSTKIDGNRATAASEVICQLTDDRSALSACLDRVKTSNGTPYYDSLVQVAEQVFRNKPSEDLRGRRAIVALTDGVDSTSGLDFDSVREELDRIGAVSYFIKVDTREFFESELLGDCESAMRFSTAQIRRYYRRIAAKAGMEKASRFCELGDFERLAVSKALYEIADAEMNELAKMSGGKVFPVETIGDARGAFRSVAAEIGTKYTLSYSPTNDKRDGTMRKIKVEVVGLPKGTSVRFREGYTAPSN